MDATREVRSLGANKYSFWLGSQKYTLSTSLDAEKFFRIVDGARELVNSLPQKLSQDEKLFLALMELSLRADSLACRINELSARFAEESEA